MNKKLSTLMASALMLAASFGASASDDLTNGGEYFLKTGDSEYLSVKGDTLALLSNAEFQALDKFEKRAATWEISWEGTLPGDKAYTFKNVKSDKLLSVADTTGSIFANVKGGISQFTWADPTSGSELENKINGEDNAISIAKGFTLTKMYDNTGAAVDYSNLLGSEKGFESAVSVSAYSAEDYTPITVNDQTTLDNAKKIVKNIDAALAKYGLSRKSAKPAKIADYKTWADAVDAVDTYASTIELNSLDSYFGVSSFTSTDVVLVASEYGIAVNVNDTVYGVVKDGMTDAALKYAPGTVFISNALTLLYEVKSIASNFGTAGDITLTDGIGSTLIADADNDPSYPNDFINNFATEKNQVNSAVAIQLDFTKGAKDVTATENILKGTNLRFVVKNLLLNGNGESKPAAAALATTDFNSALMIQDTETGKYLYVSDDIYDQSTSSTYFQLKWVDLKDLSEEMTITHAVDGVSYNNICDEKGNALPHAGSAVFHINLDNDSSIVIAPRFVYTNKPATADTTGTNYTRTDNKTDYKYRLGLKKFASSVVLTLINTDSDKEYKIYLNEGNFYTKATTESDVYFIRLASNKADKGKYYTADGLKNLTEYEKNNYPENQWALYTDKEDSTVTIINRATEDAYLEIGSTTFKDINLYKGTDLKADFDGYVTIPGGDTLMITPVDSIYKMDASIGNYDYDKEFNDVLSHEFAYYNGLDNTKKLNADKNGNLFVDPEGESVEFTLVVKADVSYGAPKIEGKSVELKKPAYAMYTSIKDTAYYVVEKDGKYIIKKQAEAEADAVKFNLREIQAADSTICYVFVESDNSGKMSVDDETLLLFKEELTETRTSMFSISSEKYDKYRRLGTTIEDGIAAYDTAYVEFFKANEPNRYLYENTRNIVAGEKADGMNYLGVYNKLDTVRNASIFVDTAYVADNTIMPTYMLALGVTADKDTLTGRYLVSLKDSTKTSYKYNNMTRLAFVNATHKGDSLIIARVGATKKDTIKIEAGKLNEATFAFELVDKVEKNADANFYLKNKDGYVQFVNGVPVLTAEATDKDNAIAFNVKKTDVVPTANEEISAEGVKVIAGEGYVVVKGAEGKKVVVANILGQTVANTVVSSDEARIAAPAGVVVVSVEGEAAVKAVVK